MTHKLETAAHVALLAPVPLEHLKDGREVSQREGRVAFGSMKYEFFLKLDDLRKGMPIDVYIYASHADGHHDPEVTWRARYLRYVKSDLGAHPDEMKFRPPSTAKYPGDNSGHWAVFWEVEDLQELGLEHRLSLGDLTGYGKKKAYGYAFRPEGPMLIEHP